MQVDGVAAARAGDVGIGVEACGGVGQLFGRHIEEAGLGEPLEAVAPAIATGDAARLSNREIDCAPVKEEVFGNLAAGLPAADDEKCAGWEARRVAILAGVKLCDGGRQVGA